MLTHKGTQRLETSRLILRRFTIEDAQQMFWNWASEDEVTKYLTWPTHSDWNVTKMVLSDWSAKYDKLDFYNWAIEQKELKEVIGNISVVSYHDETCQQISVIVSVQNGGDKALCRKRLVRC